MSVRTYNPSVRVGNWNEDIQLEEDALKDFLERRENGQLLIQKSASLNASALGKVNLSVSRDGKVHFGNSAMLMNQGARDGSRSTCVISIGMSQGGDGPPSFPVSASTKVEPSARNALVIVSLDGTAPGQALQYGQSFYLCTPGDQPMYLSSDRATFMKSAKKSRHNEVLFVCKPSHLTEWKVLPFDPLVRMELEYAPVPANEKVIIAHVKTNMDLCLEKEFLSRTPFGQEFEVSAFTSLDTHKAEQDVNHWMVVMNVPGDLTMPMEPPKQDSPPQTQQQTPTQ